MIYKIFVFFPSFYFFFLCLNWLVKNSFLKCFYTHTEKVENIRSDQSFTLKKSRPWIWLCFLPLFLFFFLKFNWLFFVFENSSWTSAPPFRSAPHGFAGSAPLHSGPRSNFRSQKRKIISWISKKKTETMVEHTPNSAIYVFLV